MFFEAQEWPIKTGSRVKLIPTVSSQDTNRFCWQIKQISIYLEAKKVQKFTISRGKYASLRRKNTKPQSEQNYRFNFNFNKFVGHPFD